MTIEEMIQEITLLYKGSLLFRGSLLCWGFLPYRGSLISGVTVIAIPYR